MKSFNRIALGTLFASLFLLSGCEGVDRWAKREQALKPLKEQYYNGELSWNEYRVKKQALIADMERTDYMTPYEHKQALREAIDSHNTNLQYKRKANEEDSEITLKQDEAMIKDSEMAPTSEADVEGMARAEEATEAPSNDMVRAQADIDYGMLSRSIKSDSTPRNSGITLSSPPREAQPTTTPAPATVPAPAVAPATAASSSSSNEMVTDSDAVKWKKDHDGTIIYEDPTKDALPEQQVK